MAQDPAARKLNPVTWWRFNLSTSLAATLPVLVTLFLIDLNLCESGEE